ncbi:hypothetical protein, partial [Jatrophihabitans sp.]|uniref:hypothetical protein n=1 Tax=Jatrophihabitans sp. TaxID=1932789 RepID=UPI002EE72955
EAPADSRLLADLMSALTAPTAAGELAGFAEARAAYTTRFAPGSHGRALQRRPPMRHSLLSPKIAAALATGVLSLGGLGAAAYAGALPDTAQDVAHHVIGAPATHPGKGSSHAPEQAGAPTSSPAGPDATGPAAFGLCTAYAHANGQSAEGSVAFANLATAAGGADKVEAYCATIVHPGSAAASHATGAPSTVPAHPTGQPSTVPAHPTGQPSTLPAHPTGQPSTLPAHPTGQPSTLPAHPTGKPSTLPAHPTGKPSTVPAPTGHPTGR